MREINAIIQPFLADKVLDALHQIPEMPGVTVSEVRGYGRRKEAKPIDREREAEVFGDKRVKLETVVPDPLVDQRVAVAADTPLPRGDVTETFKRHPLTWIICLEQ